MKLTEISDSYKETAHSFLEKWGQGQLICDLCGLICGHESPSISISAG